MQQSKKCLLIDDDEDDQEIFLMCIKKVDPAIDCLTVSNAPVAIELLESDKQYIPDYIFVDVNMPKMNGLECLKILKEMKRLNNTKIFMYSTTSSSESLQQSRKIGADDFIIKPSHTKELKERLSKIFKIVSGIE